MHRYTIENERFIFSCIENTHAYTSSEYVRKRVSKFIEYLKLIPEQKKVVDIPLTYSCTTTIEYDGDVYIFSLQYELSNTIHIKHVSFYKKQRN